MISHSLRIVLIGTLVGVLLALPAAAEISQQSDNDAACRAGERDADQETSGTLWFFAGCGLGVLGVVGAYVIKPDPPTSRLIGKSQEYVSYYTDCYRAKAVSIQTKNAWYGCGTQAVLTLIYYVAVVAAVSSSS